MPRPVTLIIRRKTKVPTIRQINHAWRSDWVKVGKISYADSCNIFESITGRGVIKTEAQFAKLLYDNYGPGIYHINAWRKGNVGILSFLYIELMHGGFRRMRKNVTQEEKERLENLKELRKLKKDLTESAGEERSNIQQDIDDLKEEIGFDTELISALKSTNKITGQYLKASKPVYRMHSYEEYGPGSYDNTEEVHDVESFY